MATAFWLFRSQGEQWIGAAIVAAREYPALSFAAVVIPPPSIVQQSLTASSVLFFDATMPIVSIGISIAGASYWGLAGIVLGSNASRFVSTLYSSPCCRAGPAVARSQLQNGSTIRRSFGAALAAGVLAWVLVAVPLHEQASLVKVVAVAFCVGSVVVFTYAMGLWTWRAPLPEPTVAGGLHSGMGHLTVPGGL